jgi:hypothetical protein
LPIILAACGGDASNGMTDPTFPNVRGTYTGAWSLRLTLVATGNQLTITCPGSVTLATQDGPSLGGSFLYTPTADCTAASGTVSGTVRTDGGITLSFTIPGSNSSLEDITGCAVVSEDDAMTGSVAGNQMNVSGNAVLDCLDPGQNGSGLFDPGGQQTVLFYPSAGIGAGASPGDRRGSSGTQADMDDRRCSESSQYDPGFSLAAHLVTVDATDGPRYIGVSAAAPLTASMKSAAREPAR